MNSKEAVNSFVAEHRDIVTKATQRALTEGFRDLRSDESAAAIANLYFGDRSEAERENIRGKIYDLVWSIVSLISAARPREFRESLTGVLADLKKIIDACGRGAADAGRPGSIRAEALISMTGRLPKALIPQAWKEEDFSDFGALSVKPFRQFERKNQHKGPTGEIDSAQPAAEDGGQSTIKLRSIPTARNSLLLPGLLEQFSETDQIVGISASGSIHNWPASLSALGYANVGTSPAKVTTRNIQALPNEEKEELVDLARDTIEWLRWCFGIQHQNDPLNFREIQLVAPTATTMILSDLAEIICSPWPEPIRSRELLQQLTEMPRASGERHSDLEGSLYRAVYMLMKRHAGCNGKVFREKAECIGLFGDDDSKFYEHVKGYVPMLSQARLLYAARIWIEEFLNKHSIDLADYKAVGGRTGISPEDHHDLSRWSDSLNKRLRLGAVGDLTKGSTLRFDIGRQQWRFPKFSENIQIEEMTRRLVAVVQKSRSRKLEPHDDGLRRFVSEAPKTLEAILEWYAEQCGVAVGAGAALDRLARLGLSDRLAKSHNFLTDSGEVNRAERPLREGSESASWIVRFNRDS
jgi:hypothetical protein